jgi:hypothetical protein
MAKKLEAIIKRIPQNIKTLCFQKYGLSVLSEFISCKNTENKDLIIVKKELLISNIQLPTKILIFAKSYKSSLKMLGRRQIREKVVQTLYSYHQNPIKLMF